MRARLTVHGTVPVAALRQTRDGVQQGPPADALSARAGDARQVAGARLPGRGLDLGGEAGEEFAGL